MTPPSHADTVIIGAGITGLVLARKLRQAGLNALIVERDHEAGGLLSPLFLDTLCVDKFYHHFFVGDAHLAALLAELNLHHRITWASTSVSLLDTCGLHVLTTPLDVLRFPGLSLLDKARMTRLIQRAARFRGDPELDRMRAEEWVVEMAGRRIWERFLLPLVRAKFGDRWGEISAAWLAGRISCRSTRGLRGERLGYVLPGFYELSRALAQDAGKALQLGMPATGLLVKDGRVQGVEMGGRVVRCRSAVFTGGANALRAFLGENASDIVPVISQIRSQGIICGVFRVTKKPSGAYWTNVTVRDAPFNVVVQQSLFGKTAAALPVVYASRYVPPERASTCHAETELDSLQDGLCRYFGIRHNHVTARELARTDDAGPVFSTGYGSIIRELSSTVAGFHLGGMLSSYPDRSIEQSIIEAERLIPQVEEDSRAP